MEQVSTGLISSEKEIVDKRKELAQQEFAQEAKRLRDRAKLSQKQLGILMGIEQTIISRIELANYGITLDIVLHYARTFNEDPYRLANVYWGDAPQEIADFNKKVLDSVWEMLSSIYQPPPPPTKPQTPISAKGRRNLNRATVENREDKVIEPTENGEEPKD